MAEKLITHSDDTVGAHLSAGFVVVAEDRERGVIGTLIAYPSADIVRDHLSTPHG